MSTRIAAHRGGARLWPENSLRGFRESLALGADLVELDVHLAADGALPVIHDATLSRTTDRRGRVRMRMGAELRQARLRGPDRRVTTERLPMLEEVLGVVAASDGGVLVEVKVPGRVSSRALVVRFRFTFRVSRYASLLHRLRGFVGGDAERTQKTAIVGCDFEGTSRLRTGARRVSPDASIWTRGTPTSAATRSASKR